MEWNSSLHQRSNYTIPINLISGYDIVEYDIHSAGFNCIRTFNLLPEDIINRLNDVPNKQRHIIIGKLSRNEPYKDLSNTIIDKIKSCNQAFFIANEVRDDNVISIKKDALFLFNLPNIKRVKFGKYIEYRLKNRYTSFLKLNKLEFYYNSITGTLDVKGINDELLKLHENGIIHYLKEILNIIEGSNKDSLCRYLLKFRDDYINRNLKYEAYRAFNNESFFILKDGSLLNEQIGLENIKESDVDLIDISYNYQKIFVPLISIVLNEM